jgi:hypothetical protein
MKVEIPENASLGYLGNDWQCNAGYVQSGQTCRKLAMPEHARLDFTGHAWACDQGFKRSGEQCVEMTAQEAQNERKTNAAVAALIKRRRARTVTGESCETEDQTGSDVCVSVTDVSFECRKNIDETAYTGCDANVSYEVSTDYRGRSSLDAEIECEVEVSYSGRNTYGQRSLSETDSDSHSLEAADSDSGQADISFSFSSFAEVTRAKVSSAECHIESVVLE